MPKVAPGKSLEELAQQVGTYAVDAYYFVQQGLAQTAHAVHGNRTKDACRHISGQQLAEGLRDVAVNNWGFMARTVLERWGIYSTLDFGRIVYAMIDAGIMARTDEDSIDDFRNVYDFRTAFDRGYRITATVTA